MDDEWLSDTPPTMEPLNLGDLPDTPTTPPRFSLKRKLDSMANECPVLVGFEIKIVLTLLN